MKPAVALGASIACVAVAVAIVGLDLAFDVEAVLEARSGDGAPWQVLGSAGARGGAPYAPGMEPCAPGPEVRLSVTNGRLWAGAFDVAVSYSEADGTFVQPLRESWHLARGEMRSFDFTVPPSAFEPAAALGAPKPSPQTVHVTAQIDGLFVSGCVAGEGGQGDRGGA